MSEQLSIHETSTPTTTSSSTEKMAANHVADIHREQHKGHGHLIRNSIIGFADGVTVPFALTAGLSSLGKPRVVILGGLAELFAGAISMGLGAWLASVTDKKHFEVEEAREWKEVNEAPAEEEEEIFQIFEKYGIRRDEAKGVVEGLKANHEMWVQFMMDFELKMQKPNIKDACVEGFVMGLSYFFGGLLPLIPYFIFSENVNHALFLSIGLTAIVLLVFGFVKARLLTGTGGKDAIFGAVQTLVVGAIAAAAAYGIVRAVNTSQSL